MKVKHIAVVSLGSIGRRHLRLLRKLRPDIEITAIRYGESYNFPEEMLVDRTVYSIQEALKLNIQAAIVSSPATNHLNQGQELAAAGIHLLMEKPLSSTLDGVSEFQKVIKKSEIVCLMGYVMRYDPVAISFFELLQKKHVGDILHARVECGSYLPFWRPGVDYLETVSAKRDLGGGVLLELSHEFDYIRWFFNSIDTVVAEIHNSGTLNVDVEECADIIFKTIQGFPISLHLDFNRQHPCRFCSVQGTAGELTWDATKKKLISHSLIRILRKQCLSLIKIIYIESNCYIFWTVSRIMQTRRSLLKTGLLCRKLLTPLGNLTKLELGLYCHENLCIHFCARWVKRTAKKKYSSICGKTFDCLFN